MFAVPHSLVRPAGVAELLVGALLGDPPVVEDHDVVDLVEPVGLVGDEQDRTVLGGVQQIRGENRVSRRYASILVRYQAVCSSAVKSASPS